MWLLPMEGPRGGFTGGKKKKFTSQVNQMQKEHSHLDGDAAFTCR